MKNMIHRLSVRAGISFAVSGIAYPSVALIRGYNFAEVSGYYLLGFWAYAFTALILIFEMQYRKSLRLEKTADWKSQFTKRLILEISSTLIFTPVILNFVYYFFLTTFFHGMPLHFPAWWFYNIMAVILSTVFFLLVNLGFFIDGWRESILNNERLEKENIRAKLEALQSQISPHFLFNNFNSLSALIDTDVRLAKDYLQKMSDVFRYILKNRHDEIVLLGEELLFIENYCYLLNIRFSDNLIFTITVPDSAKKNGIPPATLQLLVENAVKHNEISKRNPLHVEITADDDKLLVRNNLQLRQSLQEDSTQTGLLNVKERYHFLSSVPVSVEKTTTHFIVRLPLLKVEENDRTDR